MTEQALPFSDRDYDTLADVIRRRQTWKVIADPDRPVDIPDAVRQRADAQLLQALDDARWAPFHYPRHEDGIPEPWRCHVLHTRSCRQLAAELPGLLPDLKPNNKLAGMLSACGALVLVTWLPQFESQDATDKQRQVDREHLAAAAAMTQNLLLLLTARNLGTYWGSGTLLCEPNVWQRLKMPDNQRLMAALYVDYLPNAGEEQGIVERIAGKNRPLRSPADQLVRIVQLD